jgi:hypothetical protein
MNNSDSRHLLLFCCSCSGPKVRIFKPVEMVQTSANVQDNSVGSFRAGVHPPRHTETILMSRSIQLGWFREGGYIGAVDEACCLTITLPRRVATSG